jgi:hypothetical protein
VFAETAARAVADDIAAKLHGAGEIDPYDGRGSCYIEFGAGLVGKVDADFLSGPSPMAPFLGPSPGAGRREGPVRLHPASALVRRLSAGDRCYGFASTLSEERSKASTTATTS